MVEATTAKKPARKAPAAKAAPAPKAAPKTSNKGLYAVFATGGKQYRVKVGDMVKIEKLPEAHEKGDKLVFDKVLLVDNGSTEATIGTPYIKGAEVGATLNDIARYKTVDVVKYKPKSRYYKKYGHRQPYFEIKIDSIK